MNNYTIFKDPTRSNPLKSENKQSDQLERISKLEDKLRDLQAQHDELSNELDTNKTGCLDMKILEKETKQHINQLKNYNELKDLSMKLIQLIADSRQETLRAIMDEMGIKDDK